MTTNRQRRYQQQVAEDDVKALRASHDALAARLEASEHRLANAFKAEQETAARLAAVEAERNEVGRIAAEQAVEADKQRRRATTAESALAALRERVRGVQRWRVSAKPPTLSGLTRADDGNVMLAADVDAAVGSPAPVEDGDGR